MAQDLPVLLLRPRLQLGDEAVALHDLVGVSLCDEAAIAQQPVGDGVVAASLGEGPGHLDGGLGHGEMNGNGTTG